MHSFLVLFFLPRRTEGEVAWAAERWAAARGRQEAEITRRQEAKRLASHMQPGANAVLDGPGMGAGGRGGRYHDPAAGRGFEGAVGGGFEMVAGGSSAAGAKGAQLAALWEGDGMAEVSDGACATAAAAVRACCCVFPWRSPATCACLHCVVPRPSIRERLQVRAARQLQRQQCQRQQRAARQARAAASSAAFADTQAANQASQESGVGTPQNNTAKLASSAILFNSHALDSKGAAVPQQKACVFLHLQCCICVFCACSNNFLTRRESPHTPQLRRPRVRAAA